MIAVLNQTVLAVERTLRVFDENDDLDFSRNMDTLVNTANHLQVGDQQWNEMLDEARHSIRHSLQSNRDSTLNWGLVTLWSTFEAMTEELLLFWFNADSRAFLSWGSKISLTFEDIQNVDSIDELRTLYFEKAIRLFTSDSIEKRIDLLRRQLAVREEILFSQRLADDGIKIYLANWGPGTIKAISDKRNEIVHQLDRPLKTIDELRSAEIILERFLVNIASIIGSKLKMPVLAFGLEIPFLV